jgi:hypothetical protein
MSASAKAAHGQLPVKRDAARQTEDLLPLLSTWLRPGRSRQARSESGGWDLAGALIPPR